LEAAKVYNEMMAQSDRDHFEYGSIIYRTSTGAITHTRVRRGGPTSADFDLTGFTSDTFGDVLGVVHSHPGDRYDPSFPDRLLQPTPDASQGSGHGDPYAFQWWVDRAAQVLENRGLSASAARAKAEAQFSAFIVGGTGQAGTGSYALKAFAYGDYNNADGVLIDPTMPAC
jgi:proteasome lid subunit RPN8/RPN11